MQTKLLHAILSGAIIAFVLGFSLIPTTWQMISSQYEEPTFGPVTSGRATMEIVASCAVMAITLLSFKLIRRVEE